VPGASIYKDLGGVTGKFMFGIDAKLLPIRRLLAATPCHHVDRRRMYSEGSR
jgi:hypothetical protein